MSGSSLLFYPHYMICGSRSWHFDSYGPKSRSWHGWANKHSACNACKLCTYFSLQRCRSQSHYWLPSTQCNQAWTQALHPRIETWQRTTMTTCWCHCQSHGHEANPNWLLYTVHQRSLGLWLWQAGRKGLNENRRGKTFYLSQKSESESQ